MTATEYRLADTLQRTIDDRLDEGLRTIEQQATSLMREVATEIWRSSTRDVRPEQERIVTLLSRDQAIRSLIASSDERFQALAVRTARLEDHINELNDNGRQTREAMESAAARIREIAQSPSLHSVEAVQSQLEMVERHIAETFTHIDQRERELQTTILTQVKEHGDLIARETSRIVESMQNYVQGGAEAVGRLAQRMDEHASLFLNADHDITERVRGVVRDQTAELTEHLDLVSEKVGMHGRNQEEMRTRVERLIEHRMMGLAQLIRSDSEALQGLILQHDAQRDEATAQEREAIVQETVQGVVQGVQGAVEGTTQVVGEQVTAIGEQMTALARINDERLAELERTLQDQVMLLSSATSASVERTVERAMEQAMEQMRVTLDGAMGGTLGGMSERMSEAVDSLREAARSFDGVDEMLAESQSAALARMQEQLREQLHERLGAHIDDRITAIAKLIRSDNQILAERLGVVRGGGQAGAAGGTAGEAEADTLRQVLRSVKELQAGMANDVMGTVDRRFQAISDQLHKETQSQTEAMLKIAEVLSDRIERLSSKVDEGVGGDLQIVIDRMSDAIQAMSTVRRQAS